MKILALVGSLRKNGNTAHVIELMACELQASATRQGGHLEFDTINLGDMDLALCRGCRICFDQGEARCPLRDDLLAIKARMLEADGLIVASPVYVNDVSGIIKNWMDRLAHVCHRPEFVGKCVCLAATVGSGPPNHTLKTMRMALQSWGYHVVGARGFKMGAYTEPADFDRHFRENVAQLARSMYIGIRDRRFASPSFFSLMTFAIQQRFWQRHSRDTIDHAYWHERGWLDSNCDYYIPHQSSGGKVTLARFVGHVLGRFVS